MKTINFEFNGPQSMVIPDDHLSLDCAQSIITGKSYPLPTWNRSPKVIVDLGGHAGEFAVIARCRWPEAEIHCYEPNPELSPYLAINAERYGFVIWEQAVGRYTEKIKLFKSGYGSVANSLVDRPNQSGEFVEVECRSANEVYDQHLPNLLKIDIEGMEVPVLEQIPYERIEMIYIEFHTCQDRLDIDAMLSHSHDLWAARIGHKDQGEVFYVQKGLVEGVPV